MTNLLNIKISHQPTEAIRTRTEKLGLHMRLNKPELMSISGKSTSPNSIVLLGNEGNI